MRHSTTRQFAGALLGALAFISLHGCKRIDTVTDWPAPIPSPTGYLEDSVLTSRVRGALILSPVVNSAKIGIESHRGVVLLRGMAADSTQVDLAVFVAQTVPGVRSVESFMFSTGTAPLLAVSKGYTPDRGMLRAQRRHDHFVRSDHAGLDAAVSPSAASAAPAPLPEPSADAVPGEGVHQPSRWLSLAYNALGIRTIEDELHIKR